MFEDISIHLYLKDLLYDILDDREMCELQLTPSGIKNYSENCEG